MNRRRGTRAVTWLLVVLLVLACSCAVVHVQLSSRPTAEDGGTSRVLAAAAGFVTADSSYRIPCSGKKRRPPVNNRRLLGTRTTTGLPPPLPNKTKTTVEPPPPLLQ